MFFFKADVIAEEALMKVVPVVTDLMKQLHADYQDCKHIKTQLLVKQNEHEQKISRLEEIHQGLHAKVRINSMAKCFVSPSALGFLSAPCQHPLPLSLSEPSAPPPSYWCLLLHVERVGNE